MQTGNSKWDASDKGFDLTGTVKESSGSNFLHKDNLSQSSEDLMRMEQGRKVGAVKFEASTKEEMSRESNRAFQVTHGVGRQFTINKAEDKVKTNHNWMDKQISSRSEHREYAAPTSAPPTTMTALRTTSPSASQSLLGNAPSGSQLLTELVHTTFYFSPLADVTKTVKNWIEPYVTDGSPNAEPILYRYLDEVKVNVSAWVEKTGYDFNGSTTLRSKATFVESDNGTIYDYRGLNKVIDPPSAENNNLATTRFVESTDYGQPSGVTQNITHTKPSGDNTITIPNQGTTTTVAPGGEHFTGSSLLSTYLTVQKPMADFVGQFATKTGYSSPVTTTTTGGGANGGDYSQESGGGTQDDGPNTGGGDSTVDQEIAETTAEIEQLLKEGLAAFNRKTFDDIKALATGKYHSVYDPEVGMFAIKPTENGKWFLFERYEEKTGEEVEEFGPNLNLYANFWRLRGLLESGERNPDVLREGLELRRDFQRWTGIKNAGEFTLRLIPFGSLADKVAGENNDSWGYVILISVGDGLMLGGLVVKSGTQGARIVNGLSVAENLTGAGLAAYHGLSEDGNYGHGGDFVLRLALAGLGTRQVLLEQKLDDLRRIGASAGNGSGRAANAAGKHWSSANGDIVIDGSALPGKQGMQLSRRLTPGEMEGLQHAFDREFALIYEIGTGPNGGGGRYLLFSGDKTSVWFPVDGNYRWISHTHPAGYAKHASINDQNYLRLLQDAGSPQRRSLVIPLDDLPFWFTPMIEKYRK